MTVQKNLCFVAIWESRRGRIIFCVEDADVWNVK